MIPNALTRVGAYADLWSHLKSMDHALHRALDLDDHESLAELDKERLLTLAGFLRESISTRAADTLVSAEELSSRSPSLNYSPAIDLRQRLRDIQAFAVWRSAARMGLESKIQKLIDALDTYVSKPSASLFPKDAPREEFEVIRAILASLLRDAESPPKM